MNMFSNYVIVTFFILVCTFKVSAISKFEEFPTLHAVKSYAGNNEQTIAAQALIKRILGDDAENILPSVVPLTQLDPDYVVLKTINGRLEILAESAVSVTYGLNYYLKYYCQKHISWAGDQLGSIGSLPVIAKPLRIQVKLMYRYYQNVCTVSYSSVWWNWTRWEREIDWMALNGINLPLAFTGQEAIWHRVYKNLGCTDEDLRKYFTGPAFLAWGRMGNLHGWGGPLPESWIAKQLALQHKILKRMRSLGMIPVLPGFAGHIPVAIVNLFPNASYSRLSAWSHFNCTYSCSYLLAADDPLFKVIGKMFVEEQIKEYNGTNHIYNSDTFNEMLPQSNDTSYLASSGRAVYEAMRDADPHAVWLMQSWLFYNAKSFWQEPQVKALLTAVPKGRLLVLDLFSESYPQYERTHFFYGQPFIWCMLHNFGGNLGFYGKLQTINSVPMKALEMTNSTMVGAGITPEGINQNYFIYELMLEIGFSGKPVNLTWWLTQFVRRRYNSSNPDAATAWVTFASTVYDFRQNGRPPSKVLIRGPILKRPSLSFAGFPTWYHFDSQLNAWDSFMNALTYLPNIETVAYDAVDITRQMLSDIHRILYLLVIQQYDHRKYPDQLVRYGEEIRSLFADMDRILATDAHFMMGCWIRDARAAADSDADKDLFEMNARNQVTLWGPNGEILDYADKHWASLMSGYYAPRWELFVKHLSLALEQGVKFNHSMFVEDVFENIEKPFTFDRTPFPTIAVGNSIEVAKDLHKKWRPYLSDLPHDMF